MLNGDVAFIGVLDRIIWMVFLCHDYMTPTLFNIDLYAIFLIDGLSNWLALCQYIL